MDMQVIFSKIEYGVPLTTDDLHTLYLWGREVIQAYDTITCEVAHEEQNPDQNRRPVRSEITAR